ncbi:MAG TPA: divalent metal cation transporter, partial [Tepidisphaeraceae bacterium]|nr:divalent metal cation transporter [Tepidisphaeraceae bacterium]
MSEPDRISPAGHSPPATAQRRRGLPWRLGPGLIAGGADDDPTSIGTYTQAGAALGYSLLWMTWVTLPLVAVIQEICARVGRITGLGIAGNLRRHYSPWIVYPNVLLLVIANIITLGADIEAMGQAAKLLIGGPAIIYSIVLAGVIVLLQFLGSYRKIETVLKLLTLSLLSYIAVAFVVHVKW